MPSPHKHSDLPPPDEIEWFDGDGDGWHLKIKVGPKTADAYDAAVARQGNDTGLFDRLIRYGRLTHEHFMLKHQVGYGPDADTAAEYQILGLYLTRSANPDDETADEHKPMPTIPHRIYTFVGTLSSMASVQAFMADTGKTMVNAVHIMLQLGMEADKEFSRPGVKVYVRYSPGGAMLETSFE